MSAKKDGVRREEKPSIILEVTLPVIASRARLIEGDYRGYQTTLRAHPDNTGTIYLGTAELNCIFPLAANQAQDTSIDLDKLFGYGSAASQKLLVWADPIK